MRFSGAAQHSSQPITAQELWRRRSELGQCELIHGEVVQMTPTGLRHGTVEARLGHLLWEYVESTGQGLVLGGEVGYQLDDQTVHAADLAYHRLAPQEQDGWITEPPDLAIEILSPGDSWLQVEGKVDQYLDAGVREVWIVDPKQQQATIRRPDGSSTRSGRGSILQTALLPGFSATMERIFGC